jgi:hypothetical protein
MGQGAGSKPKPGCFQAMGQLDSTAVQPPHLDGERDVVRVARKRRGVALQIAIERQTLKPVFRLIGYRLWV